MALQKKKILITGGTGFIGSHLAQALAAKNQLTLVSRIKPKHSPRGIGTYYTIDIGSSNFHTLLKRGNFDYIFHLAAQSDPGFSVREPKEDFQRNVVHTIHLLETLRVLRKKPKLLFASSVAVYGTAKDKYLSETQTTPVPISPYGASKFAAEQYVSVYARTYGLPACSVRIFSTYGPGLRRQVVYDFIKKLSRNPQHLEILGDGTQARDLTYISDQVQNMVRISNRAKYNGDIYNLGSGRIYTTKQIAAAVMKAMNITPTISFTGQVRPADGQVWRADIKKIKSLGCIITTSLSVGIEKTLAWYQNGE